MRRRQADIKLVDSVRPLDDKRAVELAANFIGESVIFSAAVLVVVVE